MQSFVWKPGISVSTASLGNSGVIDTLNPFDHLDATESGWEYQPYELAGSSKRSRRRRLVPKCANCACSVCCALGICALVCSHGQAAEQESKSGTPLRRTAAEYREFLTRQVEEISSGMDFEVWHALEHPAGSCDRSRLTTRASVSCTRATTQGRALAYKAIGIQLISRCTSPQSVTPSFGFCCQLSQCVASSWSQ